MERKDSIDLAILVIIFTLIILLFTYSDNSKRVKEKNNSDMTIETQADTCTQDVYYLKELNGYIVVYFKDKSTIYDYTSILIEELPEELQQEIRDGKELQGIDRVYGFLENYSS